MITPIDTSWNVDKYKSQHELDHEWKLKRKFLLANKGKYDENRLISLAQIFVNIHFLGCKYAEPVMQLIKKLSEGIVEKAEKWDRQTFVPASAAVEEKVKARFNRPEPQTFAPSRREPVNFVQSQNLSSSGNWQRYPPENVPRNGDVWIRGQKRPNTDQEFNSQRGPPPLLGGGNTFKKGRPDQNEFNSFQRDRTDLNEFSSTRRGPLQESGFNSYGRDCREQIDINSFQRGRADDGEFHSAKRAGGHFDETDFSSSKRGRLDGAPTTSFSNIERKRNQENIRRVVDSGPFGRVVVFQNVGSKEESPISIIERTASAAHMTTSFDFTPHQDGVDCKLSLDGLYLATGQGKSQKIAKESACRVAIERLKETSFTIIVKAAYVGSESVDREFNNNSGANNQQSTSIDTPIADSNIGSKLLKLMGWSGGGLGKDEQGIEEPLKPYDCNVRRRGLGIENFSDFRKKIVRIIENFAYGDDKDDLVFSPEFSKEERKVIHELVRKYNLKSRSFGKEESTRRLVVFKKVRPLEIVEDLMNCGGETGKYKLISPQSVTFY
ncbi:hypothetical protein O3M35_000090 [Rhynocoris fuscipes]|uniref:NF-kappa-B-repressing factor n=2 Tax=Rhynocoris fuscipes TaxID=488301 RepID=A0AAW1DMI8_9HEMI